MRLILMGTGPFAVPSFERLRSAGHQILTVISRPETIGPKAKKAPPPSPVRLWAESHALETASPDSINTTESVEWLKSFDADILIVCDYGQILSESCLATSKLGGINLHGSLLPRFRGAAPVQWTVLSGDSVGGVTTIHMTPGLDAGPILSTRELALFPKENAADLETRLSQLGTQATEEAVKTLDAWSKSARDANSPSPGSAQDKSLATKAPRLSKQDGLLNPNYSVQLLDCQVRGLQPWPGTFANIQMASGASLRLIVQEARPIQFELADLPLGSLVYGEQLQTMKLNYSDLALVELAIVAKDGLLALDQVQPAGKRSMTASEFARGYAKQAWMKLEDAPASHPLLERMQAFKSPL